MIALLLIDSDISFEAIKKTVTPMGFETVRYRLPVKMMDNIEELNPSVLIINATDFPRQWKVATQYIKGITDKEIPIIILKSDFFSQKEADKALELGVKALISEDLDDSESTQKLKEVLVRYAPQISTTQNKAVEIKEKDNIQCLISHPKNGNIITGKVISISMTEINFLADVIANIEDIDDTVPIECTLKIDEKIISVNCFTVLQGKVSHLIFDSLDNEATKTLELYLAKKINQII